MARVSVEGMPENKQRIALGTRINANAPQNQRRRQLSPVQRGAVKMGERGKGAMMPATEPRAQRTWWSGAVVPQRLNALASAAKSKAPVIFPEDGEHGSYKRPQNAVTSMNVRSNRAAMA